MALYPQVEISVPASNRYLAHILWYVVSKKLFQKQYILKGVEMDGGGENFLIL